MNDDVSGFEGITQLAQLAVSLHELFVAYREAGFREAEAMQLVCAHIAQGSGSGE